MKQMEMKKLLIVSMAVLLVAGSTALAVAPPWRGDEGSTYQEWSFSGNDLTPSPDVVDNDFGDPLLRVDPIGDWIPGPGAWPLSGEIDVYIPNRPEPWPEEGNLDSVDMAARRQRPNSFSAG